MDLSIEINITNNREPLETDVKSSFIHKLTNVYHEIHKENGIIEINFYTDASNTIPYYNISFVILAPGNTSEAHKTDEKVELDFIIDIVEFYCSYLTKYSYK